MAKMIAFEQEAREAIKRGVGKLTKTVRSTLGPGGHNVILQKSSGFPMSWTAGRVSRFLSTRLARRMSTRNSG